MKSINNSIFLFIVLLSGALALADEDSFTSLSQLQQDDAGSALFSKTNCSGQVDQPQNTAAAPIQVDSIQLRALAGANSNTQIQAQGFFKGVVVVSLIGAISDIDYNPNQNGDPIMHFQLTGSSLDGSTQLHLYCGDAY
jgi:hypothetical protein